MDYIWHYDSPQGGITLASDGEALVGLWFDGQKYFADTLEEEHEERILPVFDDACRWLDIYFSGTAPDFTPRLKMRVSPFRKRVLEILLTIPFGHTMTYGEIAAMIAKHFDAAETVFTTPGAGGCQTMIYGLPEREIPAEESEEYEFYGEPYYGFPIC